MENTELKTNEDNLLEQINIEFGKLKESFNTQPKNMTIDDLIELSKGLVRFFQDTTNKKELNDPHKFENKQLQCLSKINQIIRELKYPIEKTRFNMTKYFCDLFNNITAPVYIYHFKINNNIYSYFIYLKKILSSMQNKESILQNIKNPTNIDIVLIRNYAEKLYSYCKDKLKYIHRKNIFGKDKVKRFFNKYFSEDGKNFSEKYIKKYKFDSLKKLDTTTTIKNLDNLKEHIKHQCLRLMNKEKARTDLQIKWEKMLSREPFNIKKLDFNEGINIFINSGSIENVRALYVFFKKGFIPAINDFQNKNLINFIITFLQDSRNFRKGKIFLSYSSILNNIIKSIKKYDKGKNVVSVINSKIKRV